jgi:glycosyltransferase involved in cell wall biosynthesis
MLLLPGHEAELFCLAAEEARELCLPIITLGSGSLSERVIHGVTGFIAKNDDEFSQYTLNLFKDDKLWNDLRLNLFNLRGKKTWDKCAQTLIDNL